MKSNIKQKIKMKYKNEIIKIKIKSYYKMKL